MMNTIEYKGYRANVEFDAKTSTLYGRIAGINDLITFEGDSQNIVKEFHNAVDDYLDFCKEVGKSPEKEYRGVFNVRIKPKLHRELAQKALTLNESLNSVVEKAIVGYLKANPIA